MTVMVVLAAALLFAGGGCASRDSDAGQPGEGGDGAKPDISAKPAEIRQKVTLYFSKHFPDKNDEFLVPEEREVTKGDEPLEAVIVRELIKGRGKEGLSRTVPEGTRLLSVSVVDGVAYVNFSREFQNKHWGGTAGERMTIYSVVNSLCELPGIDKVQFLLEGEKQESILGHMGTTVLIAPDRDLIAE